MSGTTAAVLAQAKVNLFLRVVAREESGYHQIETLFCRIQLADAVRVRATAGPCSLDAAGEAMPREGLGPVEANLAWRAATAYRDAAGWPAGFAIEIDKRIPVGGGLGGGSADAGAVLRALDSLAPGPLPAGAIAGLGAGLGADVPFLTQDATTLALAWGRGDRLLCLPPLSSRPCVVHQPDVPVSTGEAYAWLDDTSPPRRRTTQVTMADLGAWPSVVAMADNDFEAVVFMRRPRTAEFVSRCRARAGVVDLAMLSGSGSASFALPARGPDERGAWEGLRDILEAPGRAVITRTAASVAPVEVEDRG